MSSNPRRSTRVELAPFRRYPEGMPSIQVKHVPDEVHEALQRRARSAGQSLQEFLLAQLREIADREVMTEIFERARTRHVDLPSADLVQIIRDDRDSH